MDAGHVERQAASIWEVGGEMKNMSLTAYGIGIELTMLGWSHDPPFKPPEGANAYSNLLLPNL